MLRELERRTANAVRNSRVSRQAPRPSAMRDAILRHSFAREPPRASVLDLFVPGLL